VTTRRFCVLTVGRAASTALMDRLERYPDIAVPNKNIACADNELTHPVRIYLHAAAYARLSGKRIDTAEDLIDCFYEMNSGAAFAGFKTMPDRHKDIERFLARPDIQFVTLVREDVASTVASFELAEVLQSWQRRGEPQTARWKFNPHRDAAAVLERLRYVLDSQVRLRLIPNAIALVYEDLCNPDYSCPALDAFFGRRIRLDDPKPPVSAETYVPNWQEFFAFIDESQQRLTV